MGRSFSTIKLNSLKSVYLRELDDFYNAVDQLQEELLQTAKKARAAGLRIEFEHYLEQVRDLGHRLERMFSLVNENSLRITCKSMDEASQELQEMIDLECGNAASGRSPNEAVHLRIVGKELKNRYRVG